MKTSASRSAAVLDLGYLYLVVLLKLIWKVKEKLGWNRMSFQGKQVKTSPCLVLRVHADNRKPLFSIKNFMEVVFIMP
jgi:hypothetical protein